MLMDAVERASSFFQDNGRTIDQARFHYHFGELSQEDLLDVLRGYQNPDGGFANGLEVDIAAPDSNPFATDLALQVCLLAGAPGEHDLLQRAVAYLERAQDGEGNWRFSEAIYAHALAPWFQGWQWPNLNPSCSIAGHLRELGLGSETLHARVESLFGRLANPLDLVGDDFYAVMPYAFYFLPEWEHPQREFYLAGLLWWLIRQHRNDSLPDHGHFFEYVRSPDSYPARNLPAEILATRLDGLAAEQQEDGGWPSPYDPRWRGWATVQNLLVLQAFGRI
jgi:hypothetical protein